MSKKKKKNVAIKSERVEVVTPKVSKLVWVSIVLAILALAISFYLWHLHFQIAAARATSDGCTALFGVSCEDALTSETAVQFGIPLGAWGVIYYSSLLTLLLFGRIKNTIYHQTRVLAFLFSVVAAIISAALLWLMLSGRTGFCPFCATIHAINFALVFLLRIETSAPFSQIASGFLFPGKFLAGESGTHTRSAILAIVATLAVGVLVYAGAVMQTEKLHQGQATNMAAKNLAEQGSAASQQLGQTQAGDTSDASAAPARLEVFSDFQCPSCRNYAPVVEELKRHYGENLEVVFRHFPLDHSCNPIMQRPMHLFACEAAYAAEAAGRQGKFWEYHDELFDADLNQGTALYPEIARSLGLDVQRFESDRRSMAVRSKVRADIERGIQLTIHSTPTVLLNGRQLTDRNPEYVRPLIEELIANRRQQGR